MSDIAAPALRLPAALAAQLRASPWRFVVTGASGWLGMATLDLLHGALGAQAAQRVLAFGSAARELRLRDGWRVQQQPLAALNELPAAPTLLLHYAFLTRDRVAGMPLGDYVSANRALSAQVAQACARLGVGGALVLSSGAVYAADGTPAHDLQANPYGVLKLEDEAHFAHWAEAAGATLVLPRLFNLSGPYINKLDTYALATLIGAALAGEPMRIRAAHAVVRSYTAVHDLLTLALRRLAAGGGGVLRFDTAGEREVEIGELAEEVRRVLGAAVAIERPPRDVARVDRYVGDGAAYAALLREAGIAPQTLAQQIASTADDLSRRGSR